MHKHDINKTGENTNANPPKVRGPWYALVMPNHKSVSPVLIAVNLPDTVRYCSELFDFELVNCGGPAVKLVNAGNTNSNIVSCITNKTITAAILQTQPQKQLTKIPFRAAASFTTFLDSIKKVK